MQHAACLGASLAMLVPDRNGCPCRTNPPSYFVTDAATCLRCLLGSPLAHVVRHRVALYGRDTTVWLRAEDRLILGAIPSTPALSCRAQCSTARRATCIIHCHRHIRAPPASWDRKFSHQRHSSTPPLHVAVPRADWQGCLLPAAASSSSLIQQGLTPCLIASTTVRPWIAPHPRPRPRPILRSRYRPQCRIVPNVLWYLSPIASTS